MMVKSGLKVNEKIKMVEKRRLNIFEKYLTLWVLLCIGGGILLGKMVPQFAVKLDSFSVYNVSIPIAICNDWCLQPL